MGETVGGELIQRLTEANKRAWDDLYGSTDLPVWGNEPAPFVPQTLARAATLLPPSPVVLDAGTGEGRSLPYLLAAGEVVHACDASMAALGKIPFSVRNSVRLQRCDLAHLPYADGSFDLVFSVDVVETLPDLEAVLGEFRRILRKGGFLICNIPGEEDGIHGIDMAPSDGDGYLFRNTFFYRFLSEEVARDILGRSGFRVREVHLYSWKEAPHPNFRGEPHEHTSRVFLAERSE